MKSAFIILLLFNSLFSFIGRTQNLEWANALVGQGVSNIDNLTEGASTCYGLAVDQDENVYITGICNDSVDFDPSSGSDFVVAGQNDIYLAKYSSSGNLIWKRVLISQSMNHVKQLKLDQDGNILIIGSVEDTVDFDPSSGTAFITVPPGVANKMIIAKYTENGDFLWVKGVGGPYATWGADLETDANGNIYVTGSFYDSLDADPGIAEYNLVSNGLALFFSKYTENGDLLWAKHIPNCSNLGEASDIDISNDGAIFITGFFGNSLDFDPGPNTHLLTASTSSDRYFAKYTNDGDFVWANHIDVNDNIVFTTSRSVQLAIDQQENVYLVGDFKGNVDFDPSNGIYSITAGAGYATFICKYNPDGTFNWAKALVNGFCVAYGIELDCEEKLNLTGVFRYADFDPGLDDYYLQASAPSAFMNFFAKYDSDGNFNWVKQIGNNGYGSGIIRSGIVVDKGKQYIYGAFKQSGDFDPDDESEYWLTMGGIGWNSYFAKYSGDWKSSSTEINSCEDEAIVLYPTIEANYLWQNGSTDTSYTATTEGLYWVQQTNGACSKIDTFLIYINECGATELIMPNVFSPNCDGTNDLFLPVQLYNVKDYSIVIVNRWGNTVFESTSQDIGWDGTSNGNLCTEGTYFWQVTYTDHQNIKHQMNGFLHLIRN